MGPAGITLSSRQPSARRQAGLLAFGSTTGPLAFPGVNRVAECKWQPASPITVAGPRGILTRFPILSAYGGAPGAMTEHKFAQSPLANVSSLSWGGKGQRPCVKAQKRPICTGCVATIRGDQLSGHVIGPFCRSTRAREGTAGVAAAAKSLIELLLNPNGGTVAGRVVDADGAPTAGALVMLVPQPWNQRPSHLYKVVPADERGAFILRGIAPGKYEVFGLEGAVPWAWGSLDSPRLFGSRGDSVEVQEGARVTIQVEARSVRQ